MAVTSKHLINWVGGKRLLRKTIEPLVPKNIISYLEPFGGAGWVLFYKEKWADLEVYNDLDSRLVNLFRVVKYHPDELIREMNFMLSSRELFLQTIQNPGMTDIQKAARFMFLISRSFGGRGTNFGTVKRATGGATKSHINITKRIEAIHARLDKVLIENQDFEKFIKSYDHDKSFFYCDPPYTVGAGYDIVSTGDFDHKRLRNILKNITGRFLLSYDDSEKVRELYKGYEMIEVERLNGINNVTQKNKTFKELLIANYPIKDKKND
jgi:DNA adenine methylase